MDISQNLFYSQQAALKIIFGIPKHSDHYHPRARQNREIKMNTDIFEGTWEEVNGKVKKTWGKFTDDDLQQIEGNQQEIYGKLQKHYGYTHDQAEKAIKDFNDE